MPTSLQVSVSDSARRHVTCESCGPEYDYEMNRTGSGSYYGLALIVRRGEERALPKAAENLQRQLDTGCDVVPCPVGGAITGEREQEERRGIRRSLAIGLLGLIATARASWLLSVGQGRLEIRVGAIWLRYNSLSPV